jgi:hypothetical protein
MLQIPPAAERMNRAVRRRDFSVRRHRHVDPDEGQFRILNFEFCVHKINIASP